MSATVTKKLSEERRKSIVADFLFKLGTRLRMKREKLGLSQKELSDCLEIDQTNLSRYENGERDMNVSLLPLFSVYCRFPMSELFPLDESRAILDTFSKAVEITVMKRKKKDTTVARAKDKTLKARVYERDGHEIYEYVAPKATPQKSLRELYKDAEMHSEYPPYNKDEFCEYVKGRDDNIYLSLLDAGRFLAQLEDVPSKASLKTAVADYIIDEIVINRVAHRGSNEASRRAYGYYRLLYDKMMNSENSNGNWNPNRWESEGKDF